MGFWGAGRSGRNTQVRRDALKLMYLLVGESGSGKSTVAQEMEKWGYKELKSYTTREPRYEGEDSHIFITEDDYVRYKGTNEIVAYTRFNDSHYFCTRTQLYYNDVYVIDPDGIEYLKQHVDDVRFITIYIDTPLHRRIWRMWKRGDGIKNIIGRIRNDKVKFARIDWDYKILNINYAETLDLVRLITKTHDYINKYSQESLNLLEGLSING